MTNYNEELERDKEGEMLNYIGISLVLIGFMGALVISFL